MSEQFLKGIRLIQVTYLLGIILDGIWAILLTFPRLFMFVTGTERSSSDGSIDSALYIAASLMLGWTVLLVWGIRKPIERRIVLLFTAFPTVSGILLGAIMSLVNGKSSALFFVLKLSILFILFLISYFKAEKIAKSGVYT